MPPLPLNTPWHLTKSETLQHLDNLLHFSMMENETTIADPFAEVTHKVQNIKLSFLKQSNSERGFFKS